MRESILRIAALLILAGAITPAVAQAPRLTGAWPVAESVARLKPDLVHFPSSSPFNLVDVRGGADVAPPLRARAWYFAPNTSGNARAPAVVLLHGSGGVVEAREMTYGRQLAAMGVGALVVDYFGARSELAATPNERLIQITEAMALADAFAGLRWLSTRPEIASDRVALLGFSFGGMIATYGVQTQIVEKFAPHGPRFAAHVAFYAPCIVRFVDKRTTGAPVLMIAGGRDDTIDPLRCRQHVTELTANGAPAEFRIIPEAASNWDGAIAGPIRGGRNAIACSLEVQRDGAVQDLKTNSIMAGTFSRRLILGMCSSGTGYLIQADERVRAQSNAMLGAFLVRTLQR